MAETAPTTTQAQAMRLAGFIAGTLVAFNVAFYFLSKMWSEDHPTADLTTIQFSFLALTVSVAAAAFGAATAPRLIAHALATLIGLAAFVGGIGAWSAGMPGVMGTTLLIVGALLPVLAHFSWRHSRPAWSMAISLLAVLAAISFFGAPKIRGLLHVGIWTALIAPGLMIVGVIAFATIRGDYHQD